MCGCIDDDADQLDGRVQVPPTEALESMCRRAFDEVRPFILVSKNYIAVFLYIFDTSISFSSSSCLHKCGCTSGRAKRRSPWTRAILNIYVRCETGCVLGEFQHQAKKKALAVWFLMFRARIDPSSLHFNFFEVTVAYRH